MTDKTPEFADVLEWNTVPVTVGRATIAWNHVSYAVFVIFRTLSELEDEAAKAAFFCITSDRSQRDITSALVKTKLKPHNSTLAKKIQTALGDINGLAGRRNDILHLVLIDELSPEEVKPFYDRGHIKNKQGGELLDAVDDLTRDSLDKAIEIMKLGSEIQNVPYYQRQALAEAVQRYIARQKSEGSANPWGYGLLAQRPTTVLSDLENQDSSESS